MISRSRRHRHRRRTSARDRDDIKCTTNTSSSQSRPAEAVLHRPAPATLPGSPRAHQPRTSADNHVCVPSHRSTVPGVLATPPRSPDDNRRYRTGTGVAPQQDRQGSAIPLSFTYHRDLATCTQETVSYEQLSTEKRKKRQQARPRQGRRSDLSGGGSESYDEHSGSDNSASSESSASSAEYKYGGDLSTDSGNEDSFPRYPVADVPQYRASGAGQRRQQRTFRSTPLFPPSPQSTPPSSDNEEPLSSPALYQRNGRQEMNRTRPLPLNLNLNDLAPLRVHGQLRSPRAPPPPQMPQSPRVQRTAGGRHNHFHHPVSDIADWEDPAVATTEYGAQLDYLAEYPTSPAMRRPPRASTSRGVAAQHSHHRYPQHNQRSGTSISMLYPTAAAGEDAPTAEYGADLNFSCPTSPAMAAPPRPPEGSAATRSPRAPSTTNTPSTTASHGNSAIALGASPLVDYSPTTGIYPDHVQDHSFEGDVSYFREWSRKGSEESATGPHSWDYSSDREGEGGGDSFLSDRQLAPDEDIRMYNLHGGVGRSLLFDGDLELTEQTQLPLPTAPARRFLLLPPPIITTPGGIESVANFGVAEPVEKDNGEGKGEERARKRANMEDLPESIVTIFSNRRNARSASALHDTPRDIVAGAGGSRGGGLLSTVRDFGLRIMTGSNTGRCSLRISEQEN